MGTARRKELLKRRHRRIRKKISGTAERPRLFVRRTNRHMVASLIDDVAGRTITSLSTDSGDFSAPEGASKTEQAGLLGARLASKALELGIETVVFDRGGHPYHGRVRALAEKAREAGLKF